MRRTKAEAQETREQIFRAGIKVFAEKGYAAATMSDVAREAGCTRGAIYWHFKNKEAFFVETTSRLERFFTELIDSAIITRASAVEVITKAAGDVIRRFVHDTEFRRMQELVMRTVFGQGAHSPDICRPIDQKEDVALTLLEGAIRDRHLFPGWTAEIALTAISSFIGGVFIAIMDRGTEFSDEEIDELTAFLGRAIAPIDADTHENSTQKRSELVHVQGEQR